ncbi:MAG: hypothetical protein QNJ01_16385, partial [Desulfobacterales bacterium]|nr:hypothetical protein [Desulfobacterales bacterium]
MTFFPLCRGVFIHRAVLPAALCGVCLAALTMDAGPMACPRVCGPYRHYDWQDGTGCQSAQNRIAHARHHRPHKPQGDIEGKH